MVPAISVDELRDKLAQSMSHRIKRSNKATEDALEINTTRLVGLLFAHPQGPLAKSEIIPFLDYFHHRSGNSIDFFCVGYGAYWRVDDYPDGKQVAEIDRTQWWYSDRAYTNVVGHFEQETRWHDTGEACLVLLIARKESDKSVDFDYTTAIVCNLENMIRTGAISSVRAFFNAVFSHARVAPKSTTTVSDREGGRIIQQALKEGLLSLLPKVLGEKYRALEQFVVQDIGRKV